MEEDSSSRVVTRLRRRLSTESEEPKSPATPTKKKGGRLAAKPQLENIDELETISPRRTRRSIVKEVTKKDDDKTLTPTRRNTRARSVTDSCQSCDSPRALRAARRHSLNGSDNEMSLTPISRTRTTRKNSNSSLESQDEVAVNKIAKIALENIIKEEPDDQKLNEPSKDSSLINNTPPEIRRSPRLFAKKKHTPQSTSSESSLTEESKFLVVKKKEERQAVVLIESIPCVETMTQKLQSEEVLVTKKDNEVSLNTSGDNVLLKNFNEKDTAIRTGRKNKSLCFIKEKKTNQRNRSKSLSNFSTSAFKIENTFFSDNEKHHKNKSHKDGKLLFHRNSEHCVINTEESNQENNSNSGTIMPLNLKETKEKIAVFSVNSKIDAPFIENNDSDIIEKVTSNDSKNSETEADDQCVPVVNHNFRHEIKEASHQITNSSLSDKYLLNSVEEKRLDVNNSCEPMDVDETIPDDTTFKNQANKTNDFEKPEKGDKTDIDETSMLEQNKSISELSTPKLSDNIDKNNKVLTEVHSQIDVSKYTELMNAKLESQSLDIPDEKPTKIESENQNSDLLPDTHHKHKEVQKLVVTTSTPFKAAKKTINKTDIDETSMLEQNKSISELSTPKLSDNIDKKNKVLTEVTHSQIDVSKCTELTNAKLESQSLDIPDEKPTKIESENQNSDLLPDTHQKHKEVQKLVVTTSTPFKAAKKTIKHRENSKHKSMSISRTDSESSETSDESLEQNELLDEMAEDAGVGYKSGDSQDEEERRYEYENEILEKGETLTSDSYMSDDSDYEKDSFIVSSDAEDYKLLSGSNDDLGLSDNELSMSAKSKKKYNKREMKEQKLASKEMFQARHDVKKYSTKIAKKKVPKIHYSESSVNTDSDEPKIESQRKTSPNLNSILNKSNTKVLGDYTELVSETIIENTNMDEKGITVDYNEGQKQIQDPLSSSQVIKDETKSPLKYIEISTIKSPALESKVFVDAEKNVSILKTNLTLDPLGDSNDDSESSDENEQLMENYENVLSNLNEMHSTQEIKIKNTSLELNTTKDHEQDLIVENLTMTKSPLHILKDKPKSTTKTSSKSIDEINTFAITSEADKSDDDAANLKSSEVNDIDSGIKINKKKKKSLDSGHNVTTDMNIPTTEVPVEHTKEYPEKAPNTNTGKTEISEVLVSLSDRESPKKTKKKHSLGYHETSDIEANILDDINMKPTENTLDSSLKEGVVCGEMPDTDFTEKRRKKKKRTTRNDEDVEIQCEDTDLNSKLESENAPVSDRKQNESSDNIDDIPDIEVTVKAKKKKKHSTGNIDDVGTHNEDKDVTSKAEEEKASDFSSEQTETLGCRETYEGLTGKNKKKKKQHLKEAIENVEVYHDDIALEANLEHATDLTNKTRESSESNFPSPDITEKNIKKKKKHAIHSVENAVEEKETANTGHAALLSELIEKAPSQETNTQFLEEQHKKKKHKKKKADAENSNELKDLTNELPYSDFSGDVSESKVDELQSKKHKRKRSDNSENLMDEIDPEHTAPMYCEQNMNLGRKKKKVKFPSHDEADEFDGIGKEMIESDIDILKAKQKKLKNMDIAQIILSEMGATNEEFHSAKSDKKKKKLRKREKSLENDNTETDQRNEVADHNTRFKNDVEFSQADQIAENPEIITKKLKKRKRRDEDELHKIKSVKSSEVAFSHFNIPRLPMTVLEQLEDKPRFKKPKLEVQRKVISTTSFHVEETKTKKAKPSEYLEQSVRIDSMSPQPKKKKSKLFSLAPVPSSSACGFTTTFKINVVPKETQFVAQSSNTSSFKRDHLYKKNIKRQSTYELYKKQRKLKLTKF